MVIFTIFMMANDAGKRVSSNYSGKRFKGQFTKGPKKTNCLPRGLFDSPPLFKGQFTKGPKKTTVYQGDCLSPPLPPKRGVYQSDSYPRGGFRIKPNCFQITATSIVFDFEKCPLLWLFLK